MYIDGMENSTELEGLEAIRKWKIRGGGGKGYYKQKEKQEATIQKLPTTRIELVIFRYS